MNKDKMSRKILINILCICFILVTPLLAESAVPGPTISILSPTSGTVVSKPTVQVLIQVWDSEATPTIVGRQRDGGAIETGGAIADIVIDTSRVCGGDPTNCRIYKYLWNLSSYTDNTSHTIRFFASDGATTTGSRTITITVRDANKGTGNLLVRDLSSQMCMDCHDILGHSSQTSHASPTTPSAYLNWETVCLDCHTAHNTRNIDLIKENIYSPLTGTRAVKLYTKAGDMPNSFVNSALSGTNVNSVCQVCHTKTKNPTTLASRWITTGNPEGGHYQGTSEKCSNCHLHTEGFRGRDCKQCHLSPPDTGNHGVHGESARFIYGSTVIDSTVTEYGYDCGICHSGTHQVPGGIGNSPHTVDVIFAGVASQNLKNGPPFYTRDISSRQIYTGFGGYTFNYDDGTCSNTYCHGNYPGSGMNISIKHNSGSTSPCGSACHNASNSDPGYPITGSHQRHVTSSARLSGETEDWHTYNRGYSCTLCHGDLTGIGTPSSSGAYSSYEISDKTRHVNGYVDWQFATDDPRVLGGFYSKTSGTFKPTDGITRDYGYCTVYCHSNVQGTGGYGSPSSYSTMTWTTDRNRCAGCHVPVSTAGTGTNQHGRGIATGSHTRHYAQLDREDCNNPTPCLICHQWNSDEVVNDLNDPGCNSNCDQCHDARLMPAETNELEKHVNGQVEIAFDTFYGDVGWYTGTATPGDGYGTCSNTYCHSNGTSVSTSSIPANTTLLWGAAVYRQCYDCHSNSKFSTSDYRKASPLYASGSPKPNAHQLHIRESGSTVADPSCANCHYNTTTDNINIANKLLHMNKKYEVTTGGTYPAWEGAYSGTTETVSIGAFTFKLGATNSDPSTCTNVSCHADGLGTKTAMWSDGYYCTECHNINMDTATGSTGYHHVMNSNVLTSRVYPLTAPTTSSAADANRKCIMCHVDHIIFNPMINDSSGGRAFNLRTSILDTPGDLVNYTNKDFDNSLTLGGICTSCHRNAMTKNTTNRKDDNTTTTPVVDKTNYYPSSHNYTKISTFTSEGSGNFNANCSKCHNTGNDTKTFQNTTPKFATHDNKLRRLISQLGMSTTDEAQEESICFRCHSNTADAIGGTKKSADANDWFGSVTDMSAASRDAYAVMSSYSVTTSNALYFKNTSVENPVEPRASANLLSSGTYTDNTLRWRSMSPGAGSAQEFLSATTTAGSGQRYFRIAQFVSPPVNATTTFNSGSAYNLYVHDVENNANNNCKLNYVLYKWTADDALGTNIEALTTTGEFTTTLNEKTYSFNSDNAVTLNPGDKLLLELEILADSPASTGTCDVYFGSAVRSSNLLLPASTGWRVPSGYRHNVAYYNGVHKPSPTDETRGYIASNKHVECTDCHNQHAVLRGNHNYSRTATGGSTSTLVDTNAVGWTTDMWKGYSVRLTSGTGSGQNRQISTNSTSVLTIGPTNWTTNPASGTGYTIMLLNNTGLATAGAASTITDGNKTGNNAWVTNAWAGWTVSIISGTGAGQQRTISSNTGTVLNVSPNWSPVPDATSRYTINKIPNAQKGATGVGVTTWNSTNWGGVTTYNPSTTTAALVTAQSTWEVCFKCHSSANANVTSWGGSGAAGFTDLGLEFNPNNRSGHPVVTSLNNYPNSIAPKALDVSQVSEPWKNVGNQTMTCSDCHSTSSTASKGPHGSSVKWMLAGTAKAWPYISSADNGKNTGTYWRLKDPKDNTNNWSTNLFCVNCHPIYSGDFMNVVHKEHDGRNDGFGDKCVNCHIRVPHGGKVSRLIATQNQPSRYRPSGDTTTQTDMTKFIKTTRNNYQKGDNGHCAAESCKSGTHPAALTNPGTQESW